MNYDKGFVSSQKQRKLFKKKQNNRLKEKKKKNTKRRNKSKHKNYCTKIYKGMQKGKQESG